MNRALNNRSSYCRHRNESRGFGFDPNDASEPSPGALTQFTGCSRAISIRRRRSRSPLDASRCFALWVTLASGLFAAPTGTWIEPATQGVTHGPMLGHVTANSIRIWARCTRPEGFQVWYAEEPNLANALRSETVRTKPEHDFTGWIELSDLKPNTRYYYTLGVDAGLVDVRRAGIPPSFRTLPDEREYRDPNLNPKGRFNFSFEVGSCNWQFAGNHETRYGGELDAVYATMLARLKDRIHFQIFNGDWIYEEAERPWNGARAREVTATEWATAHGLSSTPAVVELAEGITGVWANYKLYLARGRNLAAFHREIPVFATFDDHEIYNDVLGAGQVGLRVDARVPGLRGSPFAPENLRTRGNYYDRFRPFNQTHAGEVERSVFRDPALQAWRDYLGWANPDAGVGQPIRFGRGSLQAGSNVLADADADFTDLDLNRSGTLHVQWNHGNTGVYEIVRVIDRHRLEVHPAAVATEELRYSIGTNHHTRFRVANCEFFLLDTRSHRTVHNPRDPHDPSTTVLGRRQVDWLVDGLQRSEADFLFVVSSVSFMIPHDNAESTTGGAKDESWTAHAAERDRLLDGFAALGRPVFLLTGDIHNSMAIRISPTVWEFLSGPHMSTNHFITDMGGAPLTGRFVSRGRPVDIRWGTGFLQDTPKGKNPKYCVVQVNNAFNSPAADGRPRWVAYDVPQVVFQFHDGVTGELLYAESVSAR